MEAIGLALLIVGLVGLIGRGLDEGHAIKRDREAANVWATAEAAREEMHRQAEEAKAVRRADDPVIERYWAGVERRSKVLR
jgi:hypothetical protein